MTATRTFRRTRCAVHGLSSDEDGRCALCRAALERSRRPFVAHSSRLLGAVALSVIGLFWLARAPESAPKLRASAAPAVFAQQLERRARQESKAGAGTPLAEQASSGAILAGTVPDSRPGDEASAAESAAEERMNVPRTDALELILAEDRHLGESGGVRPSTRVPAPRLPDPPTPLAADRETPPPDDPRDFDLPPAEQSPKPWRPLL